MRRGTRRLSIVLSVGYAALAGHAAWNAYESVPTLTPVEGDPFAPAHKATLGPPVEGDPFASTQPDNLKPYKGEVIPLSNSVADDLSLQQQQAIAVMRARVKAEDSVPKDLGPKDKQGHPWAVIAETAIPGYALNKAAHVLGVWAAAYAAVFAVCAGGLWVWRGYKTDTQ